MANLVVAVNMKRKDAEVASHGFSIFLDPKRAKLRVGQLKEDAEISVMMEEEEPLADADAPPSNVQPTMFMSSPVLPTPGQVPLNVFTVSAASGSKCSEQETFSADQAEPMDMEVDLQQCPALKQQLAPFFSGFF